MKIAMIISSLEVGGAENLVISLSKILYEKVELKLFVIKKNNNSIFDILAKNYQIETIYLNSDYPFFNIFAARTLKRYLNEFKPEIIHSHLKASSYIYYYHFYNKDFKWVHTVHSLAEIDTKFLRRLYLRKAIKKNTIKLVAVSTTVRNSILKLYGELEVEVIANGINTKRFQNTSNKEDNYNIISVARLSKVKNQQYLIKEFSKLNKVVNKTTLTLIGDGSKRRSILKLIKDLNIEDKVQVILSSNNVEFYLERSSVFVLASKYEGLSLSILEALSSGLIVVASSASSEIIKNGVNGLITGLKEDELANVLINLFTNMKEYKYLRDSALLNLRNYSIETMADKYMNLYNRVLYD